MFPSFKSIATFAAGLVTGAVITKLVLGTAVAVVAAAETVAEVVTDTVAN